MAGREDNSFVSIAKIWKNGVATALSTSYAEAGSVYVSGPDVYVVGWAKNNVTVNGVTTVYYESAVMWKNGVVNSLTNTMAIGVSVAWSVYVSGSDVYVAGFEPASRDIRIAKVWKNGVATSLTNGNTDAAAYSVFIQ